MTPVKAVFTGRTGPWIFCAVLAVEGSAFAAQPGANGTAEVAKAQQLWSQSPHGRMLERILPPAVTPANLPEPDSEGAQLTVRYCVQCHHLPNPQMHTAEKWATIVNRMVWRMQGRGNMGSVMKDLMTGVRAPSREEIAAINRYLRKHSQKEIDPQHPGLRTEAGKMFSIACSQCHAAPDPQQHTSREWPAVVDRMKQHMSWANIVVGAPELRTVPELRTQDIVQFLQRYARGPILNR